MTGTEQRRIRVLYVDAEPDAADRTATSLERAHEAFTVDTEPNASDALERLAQEDIDCVVSEYQLPGTDGLEFFDAVQEAFPDIPFILFTAQDSEVTASEAIARGVTDYVLRDSQAGGGQHTLLANRIENAVSQRQPDPMYQRLAEQNIVGIYLIQGDEFKYVNPKMAETFGYTPEELIGMSPLEVAGENERELVAENLRRRAEGEVEDVRYQFTGRRKNGDPVEVEVHGGVVEHEGETAILGTLRDLSARKQRERQLTRLHGATRELVQCPSAVAVAEVAVEAAADILDMRVCGVFLADDTGDRLVPVAATPESEDLFGELPSFERGQGLIGRAFELGEPIISQDVPDHPAVYNPETVVRSEMVFPLADHGVFVVGSTEYESFEETEVSLAQLLASNTEVALERVIREQGIREQNRIIEALHSVVTEFQTCEEKSEIYELTVEAAAEILDFDICVVDEVRGETLHGAATSAEMPPDGYYAEKSIHEGMFGKTYRTGETQHVDDLREVPEATPARSEYRSVLSVPLGEFGIFQAVSEQVGAFDRTDRELAELLMSHVVEALNRLRRERSITDLHQATRELIQAETKQEAAEIAVETARTMVGLPLTSIQLHDETENVLRPAAYTSEIDDLLDEVPVIEPGNSLIWRAFSRGKIEVHDDVRDDPDVLNPDTVIRSEIILPLGRHGVLICNSPEVRDFEPIDVLLARTLAENTHVAMDRIEGERELRERTHEVEQQNEQLEQFARVVSHDLRNPLTVAKGRIELAREEHESDHLDAATQALDRMERLIESVLVLARQGQTIGETHHVPLRDVVDAAWETVDTATATLAVEGDLPVVEADEGRLSALFENLFRNAIEHGGKDVTVTVGGLPDGFYVEDDGPGIPRDERDHVFEAGHTTAEAGTGLGLNIVASIVEAHGWQIEVTDGAAGGARFEITRVSLEEDLAVVE